MSERKPILICAGAKGTAVLYGYVDDYPAPGEPVEIFDARMVILWRGGGLFRLVTEGPSTRDEITVAVPRVQETAWTQYFELAPAAVEAWRALD